MYSNWKLECGDPLRPATWPPRIRIGINGFGPVARNFIRCAIQSDRGVDVVAINAPGITPELLIYLIKYNTTFGPFPGVINNKVLYAKPYDPKAPNCLMLEICGRNIAYFDYKNPADIPWQWMDVEYVLDASDSLVKLEDAERHLCGGRARKVIVVGETVDIPIIFYPISYRKYQRGCSVISTGSPDALAVATLLFLLQEEFGITEGIASILSGYSSKQLIVDGPNAKEWRLGRGGGQSIIPYNLDRLLYTVAQSMPEMAEKIEITGYAVPADTGCAIDLTCRLARPIESPQALAQALVDSKTLKTLESVHLKCQPGWLLTQWCPEQPESKKSTLPKLGPLKSCDPNAPEDEYAIANRETKTSSLAVPRQLSEKKVELPKNVVQFWMGDESQCVGRDVMAADCMLTLDVPSCLKLKDGSLIKVIAWYDREMSFCKRILDLLVYMRYVDHS